MKRKGSVNTRFPLARIKKIIQVSGKYVFLGPSDFPTYDFFDLVQNRSTDF